MQNNINIDVVSLHRTSAATMQRLSVASAADSHVDQWHLNSEWRVHRPHLLRPLSRRSNRSVTRFFMPAEVSDNSFCAVSMRSSSLSVKDTLHLSSVALCDACNTVMDDTSRHQRSIQPILSSAFVLLSLSSSSSRL